MIFRSLGEGEHYGAFSMTRQQTEKYSSLDILRDPLSTPSGFSLMEIVMAMAILSIGILSAMQMGLLATRNITSGQIVTEAVVLAQREIEKIREHRTLGDLKDTFTNDPNPHDYLKIAYRFVDPLAEELEDPTSVNCGTGEYDGSGTCLTTVTVDWRRGGGGRGGRSEVTLKTLLGGSS